ncbi:MAG TPA: hypothetical protein VGP63_09610 [Planctomycetaceae bacterium]|jgi:hypothetical protein|nr:hypothetical protein [Planctomycetaceae bacterium]
MNITRFAKSAFSLVAVAALWGTISRLPLHGRGDLSQTPQTISPPANKLVPLTASLSPEARLLASKAVAKYSAARPSRVSDHFHRWRFDSLANAYSTNVELQLELSQVQNKGRFRQTFLGSPPLVFRSPYGWEVRQRTPESAREHWEYEYHVDQFLATCAEIGVPSSFQLETDFGKVSMGELLDASRRSFEPHQELCWTLVAYCTYLPEESRWTNRFGDICSYESMVAKILATPLNEGSCGGTHKHFAMAYFLAKWPVNGALRRQCGDYLRRSADALEHSQLSSGAWTPAWAMSVVGQTSDPESSSIRGVDLVQMTGHHLEWIYLAPPDLRPSTKCISRAIHFLGDALNRADITSIQKDYCAYSHAASMLQRALLGDVPSRSNHGVEPISKSARKRVNPAPAYEGSRAVVQTP